jgi:oxygen-independent coproporphyrinogen-3 oxidase
VKPAEHTGLRDLLAKYGGPAPRYTSYPPANLFHAGVRSDDCARALERLDPAAEIEVYVHIPFCEERCAYCGCFVIPTRRHEVAAPYLAALEKEIELVRRRVGGPRRAAAVHSGGGTPTYLSPQEIVQLFRSLRRGFAIDERSEVSVELDPRVTSAEHVRVLRGEGMDRASLGVQDASDEVQEAIGRHQSWEETERAFTLCRDAGVSSINVDLVYGLPGQTEERFARTLDAVAALRPDRLAVYGYAHLPSVRPHQQRIDEAALPDAAGRLRLARLAAERLAARGYLLIGLDHYALPGDELALAQCERRLARNFMGYTTRRGARVLALGTSAITDTGEGYFQNEKKLSRYGAHLERGELPVERGFIPSAEDQVRRRVIEEILANLRVEHGDFEASPQLRGAPFADYFAPELEDLAVLAQDGLVELAPRGFSVTAVGRVFLRQIAAAFDAYRRQGGAKGAVHARAV